jgi:hypothetical protein
VLALTAGEQMSYASTFSKASLIPDYAVTQVGGYVGAHTLGLGYDINKYYQAGAIIGYVPSFLAKEDLWSLTWKNSIGFYKHTGITPYVGTSLIYSFDSDTFVELPDQYPRGYYAATALRAAPYVGAQYKYERNVFYAEYTSLDHYLESYVRSDGELKFHEVITYAIGYRKYFN